MDAVRNHAARDPEPLLPLTARDRNHLLAMSAIVVGCGLQLVEALRVLGDAARAAEVLEHMLTVSAEAGLMQTVIAGGPVVRRVLADGTPDAARAPHLDGYARMLLAAWPETIRQELPKQQVHRRGGVLTGREFSILQLMSLGNSNKRIAQQLGIGPETVKSHAKRIFSRLGVSSRTEAVWKASQLGIV